MKTIEEMRKALSTYCDSCKSCYDCKIHKKGFHIFGCYNPTVLDTYVRHNYELVFGKGETPKVDLNNIYDFINKAIERDDRMVSIVFLNDGSVSVNICPVLKEE